MTYEQDPARWTSSPEEAPELLRGAFSAAQNEGPSQNQMRALALKIAAVSAGGAVAIGATKATATANVAASAATWSIGKLAGVIALAGSLATGALVWQQQSAKPEPRGVPPTTHTTPAPAVEGSSPGVVEQAAPAQRTGTAPAVGTSANQAEPAARGGSVPAPSLAPAVTQQPSAAPVESDKSAPSVAKVGSAPSAASPVTTSARVSADAPRSSRRSSSAAPSSSHAQTGNSSRQSKSEAVASSGTAAKVTEVELLRRAQGALRSRPREAYRLTEQHRQLYPGGEFAQERDALAIQALIGAGETEMARDLAVSFIKAHPTSPHAHRFREAMGIR